MLPLPPPPPPPSQCPLTPEVTHSGQRGDAGWGLGWGQGGLGGCCLVLQAVVGEGLAVAYLLWGESMGGHSPGPL